MPKRTLTQEEADYLVQEEVLPMDDKLPETYKVIHSSSWEVDGKYQTREHIVHSLADDTYWSLGEGRSGSPFTDYHYETETTLYQVEKKEVVVTQWIRIKQN